MWGNLMQEFCLTQVSDLFSVDSSVNSEQYCLLFIVYWREGQADGEDAAVAELAVDVDMAVV